MSAHDDAHLAFEDARPLGSIGVILGYFEWGIRRSAKLGARDDCGLALPPKADLCGSVRGRDSHEGERGRTHDVRNVTLSVHVFDQRDHSGREGPFVSVACHYLGSAFEYNHELASGRGMRLGLTDL
jgi:hypothetical protein